MIVPSDADDRSRVRTMIATVLIALPVASFWHLLQIGVSEAKLSRPASGDTFIAFMIGSVFLQAAGECRSARTFLKLTGWLLIGQAVNVGTYAGLLATFGLPLDRVSRFAESCALFVVLAIAGALGLSFYTARRRDGRRSRPPG